MNTADKRQYNLRSKLIAAVAMLLISCIMMVSATYAWFTLSTKPEVQGITTTVGANGNLEIALSYHNGDPAENTSSMGDANEDWDVKNFTWGNLLNLSDNSVYGLGDIALKPTALNLDGNLTDGFTLKDSPLSTPVYAADGRPQSLNSVTVVGSKYTLDGTEYKAGVGFNVNDLKGVRAIGTADSMTEWEVVFSKALSDLTSAANNSKSTAQNSLNKNGGALAGIMVDYGLGKTTATYTEEQIAPLGVMLDDLTTANGYLLDAIIAAIKAEASAADNFTSERYLAAKDLTTATYATYANSYGDTHSANIIAAVAVWESINNRITSAKAEYNDVLAFYTQGKEPTYSDLTDLLSYLMDSGKISVNGKDINDADLKSKIMSDVGSGKGVNIILGEGSGLFAELGSAVGNLGTSVPIPPVEVGNLGVVEGIPAYISTDSEPTGGAHIPAVKLILAASGGAYTGDANAQTAQVISDAFGYMVDFMFRTNASGSTLRLQTTPAQRVYSDSTSTATQGGGSTMTFTVDEEKLSVDATKNLMEAVTVVFLDTESNAIYGIGKLDMETSQLNIVEDNKVGSIEASLYLHEFNYANGKLTFGDKLAENAADLCELNANQAKAVSAMVFLDGEEVTNAEVAAEDELSVSGTLNLQFASSATLQPMQNTALKEMQGEGEYKATATVNGNSVSKTVTAGNSYTYTVDPSQLGTKVIDTVTVTMGGEDITSSAWSAPTNTISISEVTGDIVVTVTLKDA